MSKCKWSTAIGFSSLPLNISKMFPSESMKPIPRSLVALPETPSSSISLTTEQVFLTLAETLSNSCGDNTKATLGKESTVSLFGIVALLWANRPK